MANNPSSSNNEVERSKKIINDTLNVFEVFAKQVSSLTKFNQLADTRNSDDLLKSLTVAYQKNNQGFLKGAFETLKKQKDDGEISDSTYKNKTAKLEKTLDAGKPESEGTTASTIRTGVTAEMNKSFGSFLEGDITSNQLLKGVFHSIQAQLQTQFTQLLSDAVTNSLMNIVTPIANTIDQYNPLQPLLESIQSTAAELGEGLDKTIFNDGTTNILDSLFNGAKSMLSGLSGFLKSDILSPLMDGVKSIWGSLNGLFSGATSGAVSTVGGWATSIGSIVSSFFLASGGQVKGAGTETSDSIPAMLSNNEFVTRAAVVKQPGMLPLLHDINNRGLSAVNDYARRVRHSTGGIAGSPASLSSAGFSGTSFSENGSSSTTVENAVNLHVYDDPQRIINSSFSDGGMESYYLKVERNPQRLRSILGV